MKGPAVAMVAMVVMALAMAQQSEAISCGELAGMLQPCLGYLQGSGNSTPAPNCCSGARRVQAATRSQADRRTACNCAKNAAGQFKVNRNAASNLPGKCGIPTSIPINPSVDCNSLP